VHLSTNIFGRRCLSPPEDLDSLPINPRSKLHTAAVVEGLELDEAWDEYGLIGDVVVDIQSFLFSNDSE
jgi:hypothetical protein